jgi:hypothetical protein
MTAPLCQFDEGYTGDGAEVLGWIDVWLETLTRAVTALDGQGGAA